MYFYVIMPIGADRQFVEKRRIIEKIAHEKNCVAYFPFDRDRNISFDIATTLSTLRGAEFVLADLSMERPSCYYELGLAQAVGKDVYLVAEDGTDIHQAHGRNSTRFYRDMQDYDQVISAILEGAIAVGTL